MKMHSVLFLAYLSLATAFGDVSALRKILQMMQDMSAKGKEQLNAEQVAFAEFTTWCQNENSRLKSAITGHAEKIDALSTEIASTEAQSKELAGAIAQQQSNIDGFEADTSRAIAQREADHAAFLKESTDYSESVDALERALVVMQEHAHDIEGTPGAVLLQIADGLPPQAKAIVASFTALLDDPSDYTPPEAKAYEFQGSNVVDMLKRLRDQFREKLATCQKEEANSKHAFNMVHADLVHSKENAERDVQEKTNERSLKQEQSAADKKQLASTTSIKAEDEGTLADVSTECNEKTLSFDEKQKLRREELAALDKAMEILRSPEALASAEKHLSFPQLHAATALVQLEAESNLRSGQTQGSQTAGVRHQVKDLLEAAGVRLGSKRLAVLAQQVASDPFGKVKKMIDEMITRLLEEANEDAQHEGYCDTEMGKSKITRNKLSEDIDSLQSQVESGKAMIMTLSEETKQLSKEVADLETAMAEASQLRSEEKAKNVATIEDALAGQRAIAAATAVLKDFYSKAAQATALLQTHAGGIKMGSEEWTELANPNFEGTVDKNHKQGMQTFGGETYVGQQDAAGGVMALLEVTASDFASLEADTKATEAENQKSHEQFITEAKKNAAMKNRKIEMNNSDRADEELKLRDNIADLKNTQDELLAADRYHEKLVPQCIDQGMTWEERTQAREEEIKSLKEALAILNSEDVA